MSNQEALAALVARRGKRFQGDRPNIALVYERSKNGNLVVFEIKLQAAPEHGGFRLAAADPLDAYWLDVDPAYQAKARAKGKQDDREELNFVERWQAYGAKTENVQPHAADISFVALPSKKMTISLERVGGVQVPLIRCNIGKTANAVVEKIYVQSDESGWIPKVVHIDLHGLDTTTGAAVTERLNP